MKKSILPLLFLFLSYITWSQDLEIKIKNVENGLIFPTTIPVDGIFITSNIIDRLKDSKIPGASVAVISDGKIEWSKAYGITETGSLTPVTTETLFQCASIGKPITALAVLKLVDDGKIDLDENVNDKLKRWKITDNENTEVKKVTLRDLLSHSSGLTDGYGFSGYGPNEELPTLLQILNNDPLANTNKSLHIKKQPGSVEKYSGAGYLIIQLLIEDVSGYSFTDFVQKYIFDTLNMKLSTYENEPDKNLGLQIAAGHKSNGKQLKKKKYNIYPEKGAAGPWTTAEDLAKLVIGIQDALNGKADAVLSQNLTKEFLSVKINNKGLGVNLKGIEKPEAFWHAGQNLGYTGLLYGLTKKRDGAIILLNTDGGERLMQEFMTSVAMEYDWPVLNTFKSLEIPEKLKSNLVGIYETSDKSKRLFVKKKRNVLTLGSLDSKKGYQMYRIEDNSYTFKDSQDYYRISFIFDKEDTTMIYTESIGKTIELKKIN